MGYRILIVDDEPDIVAMADSFFTGKGLRDTHRPKRPGDAETGRAVPGAVKCRGTSPSTSRPRTLFPSP